MLANGAAGWRQLKKKKIDVSEYSDKKLPQLLKLSETDHTPQSLLEVAEDGVPSMLQAVEDRPQTAIGRRSEKVAGQLTHALGGCRVPFLMRRPYCTLDRRGL